VLAGISVVLCLYVAASLAWPHVVARVALLPKPGDSSWYDGCNWHGRRYERSAIFWTAVEDMTVRACPEGGIPEEDAQRHAVVATWA
jgi:hypothetical protein